MIPLRFFRAAACAYLCGSAWLWAGDDTEPAVRRPSLGFRIEYLTSPLFATHYGTASTTNPVTSSTSTATTHTPRFSLAPVVEYRLTDHISLAAELHFRHAEFFQLSDVLSGIKDPNSSSDDRRTVVVQLSNKVNYWEIPVLANYYGLRQSGFLRQMYVTAGIEWRHVGRIRSGVETLYADGSYDYSEAPVLAQSDNQAGFAGGAGFLLTSLFRVRVLPQVRVVHWQQLAFHGPSYRSARNQVEAGLGFVF